MNDGYLDLGLPTSWEDVALSLSPAPRSDWHIVPPVISPRLQAALTLLDERRRVLLVLRADGETLASIGDLFGVGRERIRQVERNAIDRLFGASASLRGECATWLHDEGIDGSAIVRFADARLDLGNWGQVPEATAWRLLLSLLRRQGGLHRMVALHDDRHLIVDHVKHRISVVEPWLRNLGDFADTTDLSRGTGVPDRLITHGIDAFGGVVSTRNGRFFSKHLSSIELARAAARHISLHGIREWHFSHLGNLLRHILPDRFRQRSARDFAAMVSRLSKAEFESIDGGGWWRLRGEVATHLPTTEAQSTEVGQRISVIPENCEDPDASSQLEANGVRPMETASSSDVTTPGSASPSRTNDADGPGGLDERLSAAIVSTLRDANAPLTIHELATMTGAGTRNVHRVIFHDLHPRGVVVCTDGRRWALATSDDGPG